MIFKYDELKQYVKEDFNRFFNMGLDETQILPAVLNEYEHGEAFGAAENICVHIFLALNYAANEMDFNAIVKNIKKIRTEQTEDACKLELGNDYEKFVSDLKLLE